MSDSTSSGSIPTGGALPAGVTSFVGRYAVVIVLAVLFAAFSIILPESFPTSGNLSVMVNSQAVLLLLALAATVTLRNGDFELSIAATMIFCAAIAGKLTGSGWALAPAIGVTLAAGAAIGTFNGLLVVRGGLSSFVTTLGTLTALGGLTYWLTDSTTISGFSSSLLNFAQQDFLFAPLATWYGWLLVIGIWYVYEKTPVGRYMLFIGGNRDAAELAGLSVARIRLGAYICAGLISSFAGIVLAGYLGALDPGIGSQYLLQPFAAAFLGATTIHLGRFNAWGTLAALYLLVVGITGLQLLGAATWVSDLFNGLALIAAVGFARIASGGEEQE